MVFDKIIKIFKINQFDIELIENEYLVASKFKNKQPYRKIKIDLSDKTIEYYCYGKSIKKDFNLYNFFIPQTSDDWYTLLNISNDDKTKSIEKWLKDNSYYNGEFIKNINWYKENKYWLKYSSIISFEILDYIQENEINKNEFSELIKSNIESVNLMVKGKYDFKLSEIIKIQKVLNKTIINDIRLDYE